MAKNKNNTYIPPKGKPSGNGRETGHLRDAFAGTDPKTENEINAKYMDADGEPANNVPIKHANRHMHKGEDLFTPKNVPGAAGDKVEAMSKEIFAELAGYQSECCISIYVPTHPAGVEVNEKQDAIRFKSAVQALQSELLDQKMDSRKIEHMLKPCFELFQDADFWNDQSAGLATFLAPGFVKIFRLPYSVNEERHIGAAFMLSKLMPAIQDQKFFVLSLSKHDAKFYEGNAWGLTHKLIPGLPNGIDDVVHLEEKQDLQLFRQGGGGQGGANFHGHGEGQLGDKTNLEVYFKEVDRTLFQEVLHQEQAPLILAGVEYLLPIYRSASKYRHIADQGILGNQEHENNYALFTKVQEIVKPYFDEETRKRLQNYYDNIATPLTSSIPETVIKASYYAQVSDLFICKDTHLWGTFNTTDGTVIIHTEKQNGDECLIDRAAINTYLNGGSVYLLNAERMPKESIIAAFLRYNQ